MFGRVRAVVVFRDAPELPLILQLTEGGRSLGPGSRLARLSARRRHG
jgi:hypothetical protein